MGMVVKRFDVYLINLDPTVGHEIQKTRPCLVVSPDEMNRHIATAIIAPMTTRARRTKGICSIIRGGLGRTRIPAC
ncbi:MAG: type II toxin-antitoxin system PemK/MazF family toxin, partial [Ardenticatenaceae bacterium]